MPQGKKIESITIKELFDNPSDGNIPVLLDIQHEGIVWTDNSNEQENGHLRLINNNVQVVYQGKTYLPAAFSFTLPEEDGKKVGDTSISITAIDQRIINLIRSINSKPRCTFDAFYTKYNETQLMFQKLYHYNFEMDSVTWDGITAKWKLIFDPAMKLKIPVDVATINRCPSVNQNEG